MKYVVDIDALKDCIDMIETIKVNGHEYAPLHNIKLFIDRFPKERYDLDADYLVMGGATKEESSDDCV